MTSLEETWGFLGRLGDLLRVLSLSLEWRGGLDCVEALSLCFRFGLSELRFYSNRENVYVPPYGAMVTVPCCRNVSSCLSYCSHLWNVRYRNCHHSSRLPRSSVPPPDTAWAAAPSDPAGSPQTLSSLGMPMAAGCRDGPPVGCGSNGRDVASRIAVNNNNNNMVSRVYAS